MRPLKNALIGDEGDGKRNSEVWSRVSTLAPMAASGPTTRDRGRLRAGLEVEESA